MLMVKRRAILKSIPGLAALGILGTKAVTLAQDSTPVDGTPAVGTGIPPIRWNLASIDTTDDSLVPDDPSLFTVQFFPEGNIGIKADCNVGGGGYSINGESITIGDMFTTLAFCGDESIDQDFTAALMDASTWSISNDPGDLLALGLNTDGASISFKPALQGVVWQWVEFVGGDGSVITSAAPERYTLEFMDDWSVQAQLDCNSGRGSATVDGSSIDLLVATTKKMCADDSQFDDFFRVLDEAVEWIISGGDLYLNLPMDSGGARFVAIPPTFGEEATPTP
jgi:heat shock protein HslJ